MNLKHIHWGRALGGALLAEGLLIGSAFAWVAIYSYWLNPGQPLAVYEQYAQVSSPWVSILAGIPIFYALSRWLARNWPTALALFILVMVVDMLLLATASNGQLPLGLVAASHLSKLLACYLGTRSSPNPTPA